MILLDRDRQIVLSIARFGQLAAGHVRALHFDGLTERPVYRALSRLVQSKMLIRVERRMIGGTGAGSGQYTYALGSAGWAYTGRDGRYNPVRTVNYHTMGIADAYVALLDYERRGRIRIDTYETEPDSYRAGGGVVVRPDLYIEVGDLFKRHNIAFWLEVDMGNERRPKIEAKLADYMRVRNAAESFVPYVIFIVPDAHRARDMRRWIEWFPDIDSGMFMVSEGLEFIDLFFG